MYACVYDGNYERVHARMCEKYVRLLLWSICICNIGPLKKPNVK